MTRTNRAENDENLSVVRDEWLVRLQKLTSTVKGWAEELDWSTRVISKKMNDARLGNYDAPALMMQKEAIRVLLDPVARFAPGTDGIVDLYLMPGYDDIATLFLAGGEWRLHHMISGDQGTASVDLERRPLTKEILAKLLDETTAHAPEPL
jgi:hypothetical protein